MASGGPYYAGQLVRMQTWTGTTAAPTDGFRDATGALFDPATVKLIYDDPLNAPVTLTYPTLILRVSAGLYYFDVDTTAKVGIWTYEWQSPAQTIKPNWFQVLLPPL